MHAYVLQETALFVEQKYIFMPLFLSYALISQVFLNIKSRFVTVFFSVEWASDVNKYFSSFSSR